MAKGRNKKQAEKVSEKKKTVTAESGKSKKVSERREGEVEAKAKVRRNKLGQTKFKINLDS